jgi:threonine dehydrogenase-like Zn-dependent dehydrogenase
VLVRVAGCGVCGSNTPVWEGRPWFTYPRPPGEPGHEAWGVVEEVGPDVAGVRPGQPVALLTSRGFVDAAVVGADEVVVLPEALRDRDFPGEALGCGFNVARRSGFAPGQVVAVVGVGFIGAIVVRLAAAAGAHVVAVSRRATSLDLARAMGATDVVALGDPDAVLGAVSELTGGELCPVVVEATGLQAPLDLASRLTAVGGRLVIAGYHQDGTRTVDLQLWGWRGIDVVNAHERDRAVVRRGVQEAADAVAAGWFDPAPLLTHRFDLARLDEAMRAIVERPDGFVKSLVVT